MRTGRMSFSAGGQDGSFPDKQFQRRVFFNEEKLPGFVLFAPGHSREPVPAAGTYVGSVRAPLPRTATGKLFLAARESSLLHKTGSSYCGQGLIENWVAGNQKAIHQHPAHFLPSHHIADADGRPVAGIYALGNLRSLSQVQASKLDRISLGVPPVPAPCGRLPGTTGPG